ncbi:MAG: hypothetical protein U1E23_18400, partial [Reyranellaceae bacterium]
RGWRQRVFVAPEFWAGTTGCAVSWCIEHLRAKMKAFCIVVASGCHREQLWDADQVVAGHGQRELEA